MSTHLKVRQTFRPHLHEYRANLKPPLYKKQSALLFSQENKVYF